MQYVFDNKTFISTIQSFPQLWNKRDPDYADKFKKENAWSMVMKAMYGEDEVEKWETDKKNQVAKDVQKKWKNLRNSFARELARRKNCKSDSERSWKTYMYFEQLTFLMPSMAQAEVEFSLSPLQEDDCEAETINNSTGPQAKLPDRMLRKRKFPRSDSEADLPLILANSLKWKQEEEALENDSDRLFLLSLLEEFKKVPSSRKAEVRIGMISTISNGIYPQISPGYSPHSTHNSLYPQSSYPAQPSYIDSPNLPTSENIVTSLPDIFS